MSFRARARAPKLICGLSQDEGGGGGGGGHLGLWRGKGNTRDHLGLLRSPNDEFVVSMCLRCAVNINDTDLVIFGFEDISILTKTGSHVSFD